MEHELIQRFLSNQCTAAEAEAVAVYLQQHPEVLRQYLPDEEWEATASDGLPPEIRERMLLHIEHSIQPAPVRNIHRITSIAAAAAIVTAVMLLAVWLLSGGRKDHRVMADAQQKATIAPHWVNRTNGTTHTMELLLPDHSEVILAPKSVIAYKMPFEAGSREVRLLGKATFSVQASPEKPFIVYGGNVTTTALGTVFTVTAYQNEQHTKVQLSEGKVLIKPVSGGITIVLKPGEELRYDNKLLTASVGVTRTAEHKQMAVARPAGAVIMPDSILFYDAPLPEIVRTLGNAYNMDIRLAKRNIPNISFTGQFDKRKDNAVSILQTIASLNNLVVTETDSGIIISK